MRVRQVNFFLAWRFMSRNKSVGDPPDAAIRSHFLLRHFVFFNERHGYLSRVR